jgi:transposase-like protein
MPRRCTVCDHPERHGIDEALVTGAPYRSVAKRFGLSESSVYRHKTEHLPTHLLKAREVEEVAQADDLLEQVRHLQAHALDILERAEKTGDLRPPWQRSPRRGGIWSYLASSQGSWTTARR